MSNLVNSINNISSNNVPRLIDKMSDESLVSSYLNIADKLEHDYTAFSDVEMIYIFVHDEKDQDKSKNRTIDTKREYLRELLNVYFLFVEKGDLFDFTSNDAKKLFNSLNRRNIRLFQEWLRETPSGKGGKPYSVATISRKTGIFKSFLSFAHKIGYVKDPVHTYFKSASVNHKDRPNRDLNSTEALQLISYYKDHPILHCLFSILLTTGARVRELCQAKVKDLSYDEGVYWLNVLGKGGEKRDLLIHPNVFDTITRFRQRRGIDTLISPSDDSPLLTTANGKPYTYKYLSNYIGKSIDRTDLPFLNYKEQTVRAHTLRHGFAIISAEQGEDVFRIMQALGHKKIETTFIYLERHATRRNHVGHAWKNSTIMESI
ncbi:tyrosine-type recombinase/integrase [Terribacillus saccharophilus]|nr:site-specific integrase [Terribacillus goriensis]